MVFQFADKNFTNERKLNNLTAVKFLSANRNTIFIFEFKYFRNLSKLDIKFVQPVFQGNV